MGVYLAHQHDGVELFLVLDPIVESLEVRSPDTVSIELYPGRRKPATENGDRVELDLGQRAHDQAPDDKSQHRENE